MKLRYLRLAAALAVLTAVQIGPAADSEGQAAPAPTPPPCCFEIQELMSSFNQSTTLGKTEVEKKLLEAGVPASEVSELADAIVAALAKPGSRDIKVCSRAQVCVQVGVR